MDVFKHPARLLEAAHWAAVVVIAFLPLYTAADISLPLWGIVLGILLLVGIVLDIFLKGRGQLPEQVYPFFLIFDAALVSLMIYNSGGIASPLYPLLLFFAMLNSLIRSWLIAVVGTLTIGLFYIIACLAWSADSFGYDLLVRIGVMFFSAAVLSWMMALDTRVHGRSAHMETLYEISTSLSRSLDLELTLANILESTDRVFQTDISSIRLVNLNANTLVVKVSGSLEGDQSEQIEIELGEGFIGWVAKEGVPIIINDVAHDPRFAIFPKAKKKVASALAAPIYLGDTVVGVLSCASSRPIVFTDDDLQLLVTISNLASTAIERAELFERIRTRGEVIVENINSSIIVTDPEGNITLINQAALDLLGLEDDVKGENVLELLEEKVRSFNLFWQRIEEELADQVTEKEMEDSLRAGWSQELRTTGPNERYLLVKSSPIRASYEALSGFVFILDDVTERVKVDEIRNELMLMIARRVEEFSALYEMGYSLAGMSDSQYMLDMLVRRAVEMLEGSSGALSLYDPDQDSFVYKAIAGMKEELLGLSFKAGEGLPGQAVKQREPMLVERIDPSGAALLEEDVPDDLSVLLSPIIWRDKVTGVFEIYRDAGNRAFSGDDLSLLALFTSQAAIALENVNLYQIMSEDKMRMESILLSVADGVVALNNDAQVILVNSEAEKILNLPPFQEVQGCHVKEVIRNPDIANLLLKSLYTKEELALEITQSIPRNLIMEIQTSIIDDEKKERRGVVAVLRDVTRMRELEQAKSDFVSTVSHELRTPLTSIKAYTATLLREDVTFSPDTQSEFLHIIEEEADRLTRLIADLLDVSRIESGKFELKTREFDFINLVRIVVDKVLSQTDIHEVHTATPDNLTPMVADPDKIEQVLMNLLGNAVKYSPRGGTIDIEVKEYSNKIECSVKDAGVGIPKEHLVRVFEKFSRVDNRATRGIGGTGLGLYITKSIVEAHGGTIWVESSPSQGSKFHFTLPLDPARKKSQQKPEEIPRFHGPEKGI